MEKELHLSSDNLDPKTQSFRFQLEFLKFEAELIKQSIDRTDSITQTIKNWAVLIWAGSISLALGTANLKQYAWLTAILPLLFWYVDGVWRLRQRGFIYRGRKIRDFLNGSELREAFERRELGDFKVLDPSGKLYAESEDYKNFVSLRRTLRFQTVGAFYFGLSTLSVVLGLFLWLASRDGT